MSRRLAAAAAALSGLMVAGLPAGCTTRNPVIALPIPPEQLPTITAARDDIARMRRDPRELPRPVLVLSGWGDPGVVSLQMARDVRAIALEPRVTAQQFFTSWTMDHCLEAARTAAATLVPADRPGDAGPLAIDIVGKSMGGLIARELARDQHERGDGAIVHVARIFTVSTPHRGARLAALPTVDPKVIAMRPGSPFLARLDAELAAEDAPEIVAYTRTDDWMVGEANTAPAGGTVRVLPRPPLQFGHLQAGSDPRIVADILRRLRGEPPLLPEPPSIDGGEPGR